MYKRDFTRWRLFESNYDLGDTLAAIFFVGLFVLGFGGAILAAVYTSTISKHDDAAAARSHLVQVINKESVQNRTSTASAILVLNTRGITTLVKKGSDTADHTESIIVGLNQTAKSGQELSLPTETIGWATFWTLWARIYAFSVIILTFNAVFIAYCYASRDDRHFIIDLPWSKVWPVLLLVVTTMPLNWIFYTISAIRLRRFMQDTARRQRTNEQREYLHDWDFEDDYPPHPPGMREIIYDIEEKIAKKPSQVSFNHEPQAAKHLYTNMRLNGGRLQLERKRNQLTDSVSALETELRDYGEQIREAQRDRATSLAELAEVDQLLTSTSEEQQTGGIEIEFAAILALQGVTAVRVINDQLSIRLNVRVSYLEMRYDFGDWEIRVSEDGSYSTKRLRSGVRRSWSGTYPDYAYPDGSFCLGSRRRDIEENLQKGQFLEGLELMIATMHSVNKGEKHKIPLAFRKDKA